MASRSGSNPGSGTYKCYTGVTLPANEYPSGSIRVSFTFSNSGYWYGSKRVNIYLSDANGNNDHYLDNEWIESSGSASVNISGISYKDLKGKALYVYIESPEYGTSMMKINSTVSITVETALDSFSISVGASAGGSLTCSHSSASPGTQVTLYPTANTGYYFSGWTKSPSSLGISNNKFIMPEQAVSITANFAKTAYNISLASNPAEGGQVTVNRATATMGDTVTVGHIDNTGYYFTGFTISPAVTLSNNQFTMPASNITITANYLKRSTASIDRMTMQGGDTVTLTITADKDTYTHKYQLSFGTGMETLLTDVAAGVGSVSIPIPLAWCNEIPNQESKTGGSVVVKTYNGATEIGSYEIQGLTFNVPADIVPVLSNVAAQIVRTIDGITYNAIDDYYVQNHCGVRTTANAAGQLSATITGMTAAISGYSGGTYNKTVLTGSIDFTSGILYVAGTTRITVTATDSRGRSATETLTIEVQAYTAPAGSIRVWRADAEGDPDDMGEYGAYEMTRQYTQLGSNVLHWTISGTFGSAQDPPLTGDLLPGDKKHFSELMEYTVTLTLQDLLETVVITTKMPSGRFIIYAEASGNKLGFMKVPSKAIPQGKHRTVEFSDDTQIYIGDVTLEDYIRSLI